MNSNCVFYNENEVLIMMGSRGWMKPNQYLLLQQGTANCIKGFLLGKGTFDNPLICFS